MPVGFAESERNKMQETIPEREGVEPSRSFSDPANQDTDTPLQETPFSPTKFSWALEERILGHFN